VPTIEEPELTSAEFLASAKALGIGFAWVIVELAPDGILVTDDDGRILLANRHIEQLFGHDRDTLIGAHVESLVPARSRHVHEEHRASYITAPAIRAMGAGLELFGSRADGTEFPIEISLSPAATDHGPATIVVIRDVTDQRALEQSARALSELKNHDRIAGDLHDRVIGHLFGCGLTLASVLGRHNLDHRMTEQLHDVIDELDNAIRHIRNTVFESIELSRNTTQS
jgi:PAS domain S-box-containing protein